MVKKIKGGRKREETENRRRQVMKYNKNKQIFQHNALTVEDKTIHKGTKEKKKPVVQSLP